MERQHGLVQSHSRCTEKLLTLHWWFRPESNRRPYVFQTYALPRLSYRTEKDTIPHRDMNVNGAGYGDRTHDLFFTREALYQTELNRQELNRMLSLNMIPVVNRLIHESPTRRRRTVTTKTGFALETPIRRILVAIVKRHHMSKHE